MNESNSARPQQNIALQISATFVAEPLKPTLEYWFNLLGHVLTLQFLPYNQVFQHLLGQPAAGHVESTFDLCLVKMDDWGEADSIAKQTDLFIDALTQASQNRQNHIIVKACPPAPINRTQQRQVYIESEQKIARAVESLPNAYFLPSDSENSCYAVAPYYDEYTQAIAAKPYTDAMYTAIATEIARLIYGLLIPTKKVIVLDCDNTLWKGVVGEDGPNGIEINTAFTNFQKKILDCYNQGMLLCLCSKNNEQDALDVFLSRSDMVLKMEHIVAHRINWMPKSANIRELADELNLGLDSFIFIDDDPVQCQEVSAALTQVTVLKMPKNEKEIQQVTRHFWPLDVVKRHHSGKERSEFYRQDIARKSLKTHHHSLHDFIQSLNISLRIFEITAQTLARASELSIRTNQFNLNGTRYNESDLQILMHKKDFALFLVEVSDRFGEYGIVSLLVCEKDKRNNTLQILDMMMSCRAMGRGIEYTIVNYLAEFALQNSLTKLVFSYRSLPKNTPAQLFLKSLPVNKQLDQEDSSYFELCAQTALNLRYTEISHEQETQTSEERLKSPSQTTPAHNRDENPPVDFGDIAYTLNSVHKIEKAVTQSLAHTRHVTFQNRDIPQELLPSTDFEKYIAATWTKLLGIKTLSIDDNFFSVGGDSLNAIQFSSLLNFQFGVSLSIKEIMQFDSLGELAKLVEHRVHNENGMDKYWCKDEHIHLNSHECNGSVPTPGLVNGWYEEGQPNRFNLPVLYRFSPHQFTIEHLETALNILLSFHDGIRARLWQHNGRLRQEIFPHTPIKLPTYHLSHLSYEEGCKVMREKDSEIQNSFTYSKDTPLYRFAYFKLDADQPHRLLAVFHHFICDAISINLFSQSLIKVYSQLTQRRPVYLPKKYMNIANWYEKIDRFSQDEALNQSTSWDLLSQCPDVQALPLDSNTQKIRRMQRYYERDINHAFGDRLIAFAANHGVELADIFTYAFYKVYVKYSGGQALWARVNHNGRTGLFNDAEANHLFGMLLTSSHVLFQIPVDMTLLQALHLIKTQRGQMPQNGIGFTALRYQNNDSTVREKYKARMPKVYLNFALQNAANQKSISDVNLVSLAPEETAYPSDTVALDVEHDLYFVVRWKRNLLNMEIAYPIDNFHEATISTLLSDIESELSSLMSEHDENQYSPISTFAFHE
ncbi:Chondramide synthase cmdD [Thalassocella blandensis]|nr:Chondramide synthase cmdD [Thalassocella blandensis]